MTTDTVAMTPAASKPAMPKVLRFALRDLRGGIGGFYIFLACIALGVAIISGIGALTDALRNGLSQQGQELLGGDVALSRAHVRANAAERQWLAARGQVTEMANMRSMARTLDGKNQALVELKAVDGMHPLYGNVTLSGAKDLQSAIGKGGAVVDNILLERLGLKAGDKIRLGNADIPVTGTLVREPDQASARLPFGPRVLLSQASLESTGLVQPGSLVRWTYRIKLADGADTPKLVSFAAALKEALPQAGFVVADRRDPAPAVTRSIERLRQFLTLIGLTSLIVGGVGVANAVTNFLDRKRKVIATFKSLGASSSLVFRIFLVEILLLTLPGIAIGLALGYLFPTMAMAIFGDTLPIRLDVSVRWTTLAMASLYGLLVSLVFMLWPLGRMEHVRASALFRDAFDMERRLPPRPVLLATGAAALLLIASAVASSDSRWLALWFCLGVAAVLAVFVAIGAGVAIGARRIARPRRPEIALALGNIGGPGSLTRAVVLSLGTGLSLLVAVALANTSIIAEFVERLPANAPTYYVLDINKAEWPDFERIVKHEAPGAVVAEAPMLRGRIVSLAGTPVEKLKNVPPEAQWVINGDRGLTFDADVPKGSRVVEGEWWPSNYTGEPLVSFEVELARKLGVKIGDLITVNVLGRNITARLTNLREIKWENLTINFVLVFSPNALQAAPYNLLATITLPAAHAEADEARLVQALTAKLPTITAIRVKDAIDAFNDVFGKVMTAVRAAGGVTLFAGALVLAGALATAQRRRIYQAVVLKTLGATSRRILLSHLVEYLMLATVTAAVAAVLGTISAWIVVTRIMDLDFAFSIWAVLQSLVVATLLVLVFGLAGTWRVLKARPVPYLRSE